jgi:hypothetical protein
MSVISGTSIPTNGLILNLDAANIKSYPGTGTTWYDLSGNNNSGSLINGAYWTGSNGGVMKMDGINDYIKVTNLNCSGYSNTIIVASRYSGTTYGRVIASMTENWLIGHWAGYTEGAYPQVLTIGGYRDNNWRIYALTQNTTGNVKLLYINGKLLYSAAGSLGCNGMCIGAWTGASEYSTSECGFVLVYNRILSASEIFNMYLYYRDRYFVPPKTPFIFPDGSSPTDATMITPAEISSMGIKGVWANKKKVTTYNGPLWRIRRFWDNQLADCYSLADVASHSLSNTAWVDIWYDQSGNNNNFTESIGAHQPVLVASDPSVNNQPMVCLVSEDAFYDGMRCSTLIDSGSADSTYCIGYTIDKTGLTGARVLQGSNNWLMGPYNMKHSLFTGNWVIGSTAVSGSAVLLSAWRSGSSNFNLRLNGQNSGSTGANTVPGTISLGVRGAYGEQAGSRVFEIIIANPSSTNDTTKVAAIEAKLLQDYTFY